MRITKEKAYRNTFVAEYTDLTDFAFNLQNRRWPKAFGSSEADWAGGTPNEVIKICRTGDEKWARRAEKMVDQIANVAISNIGMDLEYNLVHGVLDHAAMMAGDPMCMYGTTITETDKAPVGVYIDNWISSTVPNQIIERRGAAVLALVLALSIYRPVVCKFVSASGASFDHKSDNIQLIPVPTHPMDLGRAAFMLACPMFTRAGTYQMSNTIHNMDGWDAGPIMGRGNGEYWQKNDLGKWAADRDGAEEVVFLPMMRDHANYKYFQSDKDALEWVQSQLKKFI
ncbi:MAG: hypothetical protein GKR86_01045 [Ilumatobacter sp.]|nr:hypothetical protein [Ilumatobacter sp.]